MRKCSLPADSGRIGEIESPGAMCIRADAEHEHRGRADRAAEVRVMNVAEGLKKRSE